MKIKVCGLNDAVSIERLTLLQPDYMGFIYYAGSPRFAAQVNYGLLAALPKNIEQTAVFVNESASHIHQMMADYRFSAVQLHGHESPEFCAQFRGQVKVLKAFGIDDDFDFSGLLPYVDAVDYFLFDTRSGVYGGSGKTFNWELLNRYTLDVPFFLSGGLSLVNIEDVKQITHPQFYGVDLNSRFETAPGVKDIDKLKRAFNSLRSAS